MGPSVRVGERHFTPVRYLVKHYHGFLHKMMDSSPDRQLNVVHRFYSRKRLAEARFHGKIGCRYRVSPLIMKGLKPGSG